ncbi:Hypothetical Protein FCC1311_040832 [Hondaea fermentalgiana]|uniref:Uncharacterized protein n=1 Tax=Hondaea fermentalgiana TaxID=2315210 RepID=A0A2R5GA08_9STRA|nr:Hypothetical Protein FCC1311_040832 [Hondaea fermentalgiana]|eukprot:GBG27860.1 Hypothetical Protein FCC1311_040832 [Hondaea fermentalgiana]
MTERQALYSRLVEFFQRYDPGRLEHGIDAVVDFGLAEGLDALNAALVDRYGAYLGSGVDTADFGDAERAILRSRIEMFYIKHDVAKLDSPTDIDAITDWALHNGVDVLSEKLARKFGEGVEDVFESDVLVQLEAFYEKYDPSKSEEDVRTVLTWGIVHGFTTLNQKMISKYGEGLGSMDRAKVRAEIERKLISFYEANAPEKLDPDNLEFVVDFTLKHGIHDMNRRLQQKYGVNMNTILRRSTTKSRPASRSASLRRSLRQSMASLRRSQRKSGSLASSAREEAEAQVEADLAYQEYLRKLVEVFYARHDPNRLLEEGVTPIIEFAIEAGEVALNEKLRAKYGQDLIDIDAEFQSVREQLVRFYARFDPTKLEPENEHQLDTVTGWALVNGLDRLNETLRRKYDDDLDGTGLRARLRLFYDAVGAKKSDKDIQTIVDWCYENSVEALNKKLKKRYGKSLEDTTFAEEPDLGQGRPRGDTEASVGPPHPDMPPPRPASTYKYTREAPLPPGPPPLVDLPEEHERSKQGAALEAKILVFYSKKDPAKATPEQVAKDAARILEDGIDAFNAELMELYGESLVSLDRGRSSVRMSTRSSVRSSSFRASRKVAVDKV